MKRFFLTVLAVLCLAAPASAQEDDPFLVTEPARPEALGPVSETAECFHLVNKAPYTVFGSIHTNYYIREDGIKTRHKSNFRLEKDRVAEFCTSGPFYDGHKLELVLKTLIPVFECKTGINGDIIIHGWHKDGGGTETSAHCL